MLAVFFFFLYSHVEISIVIFISFHTYRGSFVCCVTLRHKISTIDFLNEENADFSFFFNHLNKQIYDSYGLFINTKTEVKDISDTLDFTVVSMI